MISLLPGTTPQDTDGIYKIIDLLSDPKKVKAQLDEIVAAKQGALNVLKQAQDAQDAADAKHKTAAVREAALASREANLVSREAAVAARESAVGIREALWEQTKREIKETLVAAGA